LFCFCNKPTGSFLELPRVRLAPVAGLRVGRGVTPTVLEDFNADTTFGHVAPR